MYTIFLITNYLITNYELNAANELILFIMNYQLRILMKNMVINKTQPIRNS